jgi:hypothetical protein
MPWTRLWGRAAVAAISLVLVCPLLARASEGQATDFAQLHEDLRVGDPVAVTMRDGTTIRGKTVEISDAGLVVLVGGSRTEVPAGQVVRIERRRNGILLGALIGAGAGVAFGLAARSYAFNEGGNEAAAFLLPTAIGLGAGIGIDALLVRPRTVFERPREAAARFGVIIGRGRTGLQMSVAF